MVPFADRDDGGRQLAPVVGQTLARWAADTAHPPAHRVPLVLALPRGGVPVAAPVAAALGAELDVQVVRKVGLPWQPELGIGAVTADGPAVLDADLLSRVRLDSDELARHVEAARAEVRRRLARYRGDAPAPAVAGRVVVVVDDGLATGVSARAALRAVRAEHPARLIFAAPVASADRAAALVTGGDADEVVCLVWADRLGAVGRWYTDFAQVSDAAVVMLLDAARPPSAG